MWPSEARPQHCRRIQVVCWTDSSPSPSAVSAAAAGRPRREHRTAVATMGWTDSGECENRGSALKKTLLRRRRPRTRGPTALSCRCGAAPQARPCGGRRLWTSSCVAVFVARLLAVANQPEGTDVQPSRWRMLPSKGGAGGNGHCASIVLLAGTVALSLRSGLLGSQLAKAKDARPGRGA